MREFVIRQNFTEGVKFTQTAADQLRSLRTEIKNDDFLLHRLMYVFFRRRKSRAFYEKNQCLQLNYFVYLMLCTYIRLSLGIIKVNFAFALNFCYICTALKS